MQLKQFLTLISFTIGFYSAVFANEAPVVDAVQQQAEDSSVAAEPVSSSGSGWQPVSADSNPPVSQSNAQVSQSTASSAPPPQQQWVSAQNNVAQNNVVPSSRSNDPVDKRVSRLEQQMSNYSQMNLPQEVNDLQQKLATLEGQHEVDQRELKKLTEEQKTYYQDLQQQVSQLKQGSATAAQDKMESSLALNKSVDTPVTSVDTAKKENEDNHDAVTAQNEDQKRTTLAYNEEMIAPIDGDTPLYQKAFRLLSGKHFNQANDAFKNYLQTYPNGQFAVNAHFWLGEIALMNQHYDAASDQFQTVVSKYPTSNKVSDAKLKIAMIHAAKGETDTAKNEFTQIRKEYPGSTAAQLASIRLQQISGGVIVE